MLMFTSTPFQDEMRRAVIMKVVSCTLLA